MQKRYLVLFIKMLLGTTFFIPLVLMPQSFIFPFIVPKILLFRSLTLLMLGGYILLLVSQYKAYKLRATTINIMVALFFVSFVVSTFVGVDWYRSFWDNHERMLGLFTIFHYVLYYYIVSAVITEWRDWRWLLRIFLLAGSIVMVIGLIQKFVDPQLFVNQGKDRVQSTLGNSIYVGGYGLFLFFLGYLLSVKEEKKYWKYFAAVGSLLGMIGIFLSGTRGALLAWMSGVFILFVLYLIFFTGAKRVKQVIVSLMILGVVLLAVLYLFRQTDFVRSIPAVGRLVNTSIRSDSGGTRIMAWGIALESWKEKPVFGWGPNNFYYAFNKYYKPEFLRHGWAETWFDNAHNIIVNTLAVQGMVGLVLYFGLFGAAIFVLWRDRKGENWDFHLAVVGTAFLCAHLLNNVFVFENPTSYLYFFFFLAFINSLKGKRQGAGEELKIKNVSIGLLVLVSLIVLLFIYSTDIKTAQANSTTLRAIRNLSQGRYTEALSSYEKAVSFGSPHLDDIRLDFARTAEQAAANLFFSKVKWSQEFIELLVKAQVDLQKNYVLHPLDIRTHFMDVQISMERSSLTKDATFTSYAIKRLEEALAISPKRQQTQYLLASIYVDSGLITEAENLLMAGIEYDPQISEGWWRLIALYDSQGKKEEAVRLLQEAANKQVGFRGDAKKAMQKIVSSSPQVYGELWKKF